MTPAVYVVNLAIEEIVTNILKYGYDDTAIHEILLRIEIHPGAVRLVLEDDGHEFNPLKVPEPDVNLPPNTAIPAVSASISSVSWSKGWIMSGAGGEIGSRSGFGPDPERCQNRAGVPTALSCRINRNAVGSSESLAKTGRPFAPRTI